MLVLQTAGTNEAKRNSAMAEIRPCVYFGLGLSHLVGPQTDWRPPGF